VDHARILYNKGLYLQSLRTLDRIKENAKAHNQVTFLLQVLFFEKKIEAWHITRVCRTGRSSHGGGGRGERAFATGEQALQSLPAAL